MKTRALGELAILAGVCLILAAGAVSHAAVTVFHYRTTDSTVLPTIPSIGGADGTAQGSMTLIADVPTVDVPAGAGNRSISINGGGVTSAATQELTNALVMANDGFTYETWFKWNGGGNVNSIIDYAGTEKFRLTGGNLDLNFDSGSGAQVLVASPTPNEWHYIAAVFDYDGNPEVGGKIGGELTWYYDGNVPTGTASVVKDDFGDSLNRSIGVGRHPLGFGADYFDGLVYEPRVTLGALTAPELLIDPAPQLVQPGGAGVIGDETIADSQQNVALGGTAAQSSDYSSSYPAVRAIDGNTGNFTHTHNSDPNPATWQVLLDDSYEIDEIVVHNRDSCCQSRLRDLTVEVMDFSGALGSDFAEGTGGTVQLNTNTELSAYVNADNTWNALTGVVYGSSQGGAPSTITLDPSAIGGGAVSGNFVRIIREPDGATGNDDRRVLALGEVQVLAAIPGDFTMFTDGTLQIELAADVPAADKLALTGELTIQPDATLDVLLLSGSPAPGQTFDILDFGSVSGMFDTVNLPGGPSQWDTTNLYTTGEIAFAAIPEPSTFALAALGLLGLAWIGWRRRGR